MKQREPFPIRGVIEGFYGTPWSHAERLDMIAFMARHQYNAYFYAPKDDPYLRQYWQTPHPIEQVAQLDELIAQTNQREMHFFYCISPGLNMEYANQEHVEQVISKFRQMFERGVCHFALLFDDIPITLKHEADRKCFKHLPDAHVQTSLSVYDTLRSWSEEIVFVVCPTLYNGLGNEFYIEYMGRHLPTDIMLFWTGRFVCSPHLLEGDAIRFEQYTSHKPLYWDNYPVNDLAMANEMHIGPLLHRDPYLYRHTQGYVANAMEYVESSKIPLITIAHYLQNPETYDPEASFRQAVEEVVGSDDAEPFLHFADNVRSSFLNDMESPKLMEALHDFRFHFLHGEQKQAVASLRKTFTEMEQSATYLLDSMKNAKLAKELRDWLRKYWYWSKVGQAAVNLIDEGRQGRFIRAFFHYLSLRKWIKKAESLPHRVCGSVMKLFAEAVLVEVKKQLT